MPKERLQKVTFKATAVVSKPVKVEFYTKKGERVSFQAKKDIPKIVKVQFLAKRKK